MQNIFSESNNNH